MSSPSPTQTGELPKFVGKYRIVRLIAKSNDTVYEAIDPHLDRHIALKELTLPPNLSGAARRERIERFQREAKAAGALTHPHIVTIYEVGQHQEHRFIAMEYLIGQTLREVLTVGGPLPVQEVMEITLQLCEALGYAHAQGVVHRDVKPDNIYLVAPNRTVKLTDFGIARMMAEPSLTSAGQVFGTPAYMSPEQLTSREVDYRSDIFSLGIVVYEMLTGQKPFRGDSVVAITYQIMNAEPEMPPSLAPGLAAIIVRALAKDPDLRYQSLRALAADLRREQRSLQETSALEQTAALTAAAQARTAQISEPTLYSASSTTALAPGAENRTGESGDEMPTQLRDSSLPLAESNEELRIRPGIDDGDDDYGFIDDGSKPSDVFRTAANTAPLLPESGSAAFFAALSADPALRSATYRLIATVAVACLLVCIALFGVVPSALARARQAHALGDAAAAYKKAGQMATEGNLDGAIAGYKAALQVGGALNDSFSSRCRRALADCYTAEAVRAQSGGDLAGAQQLYSQAGGFDAQDATALYDSATADRAGGDELGAIRAFSQAHQAEPTSPAGMSALDQAQQGYLRLGEQSLAQGNAPAARQNWQMAADLSPQSPAGQQAAARLQQTQ